MEIVDEPRCVDKDKKKLILPGIQMIKQRYDIRKILETSMLLFEKEDTDLTHSWAAYLDLYPVCQNENYPEDFRDEYKKLLDSRFDAHINSDLVYLYLHLSKIDLEFWIYKALGKTTLIKNEFKNVTTKWRKIAKTNLTTFAEIFFETVGSVPIEEPTQKRSKQNGSSALQILNDLFERINTETDDNNNEESCSMKQQIKKEIAIFKKAKEKEGFGVEFWRDRTDMPTLRNVYRHLRAIPFSNAAVERLFSRLKLCLTDKRMMLSVRTVEGLGLGHFNKDLKIKT